MAVRANGLALCAGVGGIELGVGLVVPTYRTVGVVEKESRLAAAWVDRMEAQIVDRCAIWDDLTTFQGRPWRGAVDIITAGFPCQPFSAAGHQRGTGDDRWLWSHVARVIDETWPRAVFIENVPGVIRHGLPEILSDLASLGLDAEWGTLKASEVGAPHIRDRFWLLAWDQATGKEWLANAQGTGPQAVGIWRGNEEEISGTVSDSTSNLANSNGDRRTVQILDTRWLFPPGPGDLEGWRGYIEQGGPEPVVLGGDHGLTDRMDRVHSAGNGVVPLVAATAFARLTERALT